MFFPLNLISSPRIGEFPTTLIPQVRQFLSEDFSAALPINSPLSKSTNLPNPTSKGVVFLEKSFQADKSPASILLHLKPGVADKIIPILIPSSKIKLPNFSILFSGRKYISQPSSFVKPVRLIMTL